MISKHFQNRKGRERLRSKDFLIFENSLLVFTSKRTSGGCEHGRFRRKRFCEAEFADAKRLQTASKRRMGLRYSQLIWASCSHESTYDDENILRQTAISVGACSVANGRLSRIATYAFASDGWACA